MKLFKSSRELFLTGLMLLILLGTQAIQDSPLHDHSQHGFDCTLCHFELSDDSIITDNKVLPPIDNQSIYQPALSQHLYHQHFSFYTSRAPPHTFL